MRISDWSSDVCSSDLHEGALEPAQFAGCLTENLPNEEHGERGCKRHGPCEHERRVGGQPGGHSEPRPKGSVLALSPELPWACAARPVCLGVAVGAWSRALQSGWFVKAPGGERVVQYVS